MSLKDKLENQDYEFILAAHIIPSGTSWIMNILTNLGILVDIKESNRNNFVWEFIDKNTACFSEYFSKSVGPIMFPMLMNHKVQFKEDFIVTMTHLPIFSQSLTKKVILSTRDPRDSIYSHYRRLFPLEKTSFFKIKYPDEKISFEEYLLKKYHLSEMEFIKDSINFWCMNDTHQKVMPILDDPGRWAFWTSLWFLTIPHENLMIIRFEDTKKDPVKEVHRLLDFMAIKRTESEILDAIEKSDFKKSREIELKTESSLWFHHRKGMVGEWQEVYDKQTLEIFLGLPYKVMSELGYTSEIQKDFKLKDFKNILFEVNSIRQPEVYPMENIINKLEQIDTYHDIGIDFEYLLKSLFPIKKFLSSEIKRLMLITCLAICYTKLFVSKDDSFMFGQLSFNKYETTLFKSILILIYNSDNRILNDLNQKMKFDIQL